MMAMFALTMAFTGVVHADPDKPSPLKGVMQPFPWENITGMWEISDPSMGSVYSFEVKKTADGGKVLQVTQVDQKTGLVVSRGAGVAIPGDKNTISVMMAGEDQEPYMLYVRHVRERRYSRRKHTVLTIKPLGGSGATKREHNYYLNKVSAAPISAEDLYNGGMGT